MESVPCCLTWKKIDDQSMKTVAYEICKHEGATSKCLHPADKLQIAMMYIKIPVQKSN